MISNSAVPAPVDPTNFSRILLNILCQRDRGLRVCHINAQSLLPKIDEFVHAFENSLVDVICVSETWLKPHVSDNLVAVKGYRCFRNDRSGRIGGGVAVYIKSHFKSRVVSVSDAHSETEYIFLETLIGSQKCLIGAVYNPPRCFNLDPISNAIASINHQYAHVIMCGDFNIDLLRPGSVKDLFVNTMSSLGLSTINSSPTHFTRTSSTLLDLIIVENTELVKFFNQISAPNFSKHDLVFLIYDLELDDNLVNTFTYRDFKNIDLTGLSLEASGLNWSLLFDCASVDEMVDLFEQSIMYLFDKYVPLKTINVIDQSRPWLTQRILNLINQRNNAYSRWKRFRSNDCWHFFKLLRNHVNQEIRSSKRAYYCSKFHVKLPTKQLWSNLRDIGIGKCNIHQITRDPNELNREFLSHFNQSSVSNNDSASSNNNNPSNAFSFINVTHAEILTAFAQIKSNAIGLDDMCPKFIRLILPYVLPYIAHIFNSIITSSVFPSSWKFAKIFPIPKSSSNLEYRPISILPYLSKVFERILHNQVAYFLDCNNCLSVYQSGFRQKHSCTSAIIKISDDIRQALKADMITVLVLLDFSKAFDKVDHVILVNKLRSQFNFSTNACKLIESYLSNRYQAVYCNHDLSDFLPVFSGVPQGSILGPLLFSLFINDICNVIKYCKYHLYADDFQLYFSQPRSLISVIGDTINAELTRVHSWALDNGLLLNTSKSNAIIVSKNAVEPQDRPNLSLNNEVINYSNTLRNLGIIFNESLTWCDHVDVVVRKIYATLRGLSASASYTPLETRRFIVKALIVPLITFGCEVFCSLDSMSMRKLNLAYNSAIRYAYRLRRFDHISPYSSSILGCTLQTYLNMKVILFLRNVIIFRKPRYLFEKLNFLQSSRTLNLVIPRFCNLVTERQFFVRSARLWNALPLDLKRASSRDHSFKTKLLEFLSND